MWRKLMITFLLLGALVLSQCAQNPVASPPRELNDSEKSLVAADNLFGLKLFKAINEVEDNNNVFISPLSVAMALGMTLNGADGQTKADMEATLELAGLTGEEINQSYRSLIDLLRTLDSDIDFQIANSIWCRQGFAFEQSFLEVNQNYFDALVQALDFEDPGAPGVINSWVADNTNGRITEIVESIDPHIVMFLINAIYFKGNWTYQFDANRTQAADFTLPDGSRKSVQMMELHGELDYFQNDTFQAIELPYGNQLYSMLVVLPHGNVQVDDIISGLSRAQLEEWSGLFGKQELYFYLPKFSMEYELLLNDILKELGMAVAFDQFNADFSRMYSGPQRLFIDKVKHKTFVEVNETGTEAAAVTSVEVGVVSAPPTMRVDRPFMFLIRENHSQTILFIGKIVDPN